jgi:hypothetical protein
LPQHHHAAISTSRSLAFCASLLIKEADQRVAAFTPGGGMVAAVRTVAPEGLDVILDPPELPCFGVAGTGGY